jgi:hypothetical protein
VALNELFGFLAPLATALTWLPSATKRVKIKSLSASLVFLITHARVV